LVELGCFNFQLFLKDMQINVNLFYKEFRL